jgi:hypothetical protein
MENFKKHFATCFGLVEQKLSRGPCEEWNTDDFRVLSESINEVTGTLLSVSTLKRLSGRVNYRSKPNATTLNAFAAYVGYKDWRGFLDDTNSIKFQDSKKPIKRAWIKYGKPILILGAGLLMLIFIISSSKKTARPYESNNFAFTGKSITTGLPNSVVFEYDASAAGEEATIEIQQDWDERKRVTVNRNDSVSTSIYYRPGFFKSKLVVDNIIVQEKDIFIPTQDWLGVIESKSRPIYLDEKDFRKEHYLEITPEILAQYDIDPGTSKTVVGFYQVRDFGDLHTDDFEMSVSLKNTFKSGINVCQSAQVVISHEEGPISLILTNKGCISNISLSAFNQAIDGKKTDLSDFGVDFSEHVQLECISKNQKLDISINNKTVFRFDVPKTPRKIVGIAIFFEGAGSVNHVELKKQGEVVYASKF